MATIETRNEQGELVAATGETPSELSESLAALGVPGTHRVTFCDCDEACSHQSFFVSATAWRAA